MKKILIIILFLIVSLHGTASFTSDTLSIKNKVDIKRYNRELKEFLHFVRDSVFKHQDTLFTRNYLYNNQMFLGVALYGRKGLTAIEKNEIANAMNLDTIKYSLYKHILKRTIFLADSDERIWKLSKPIFIRNYRLCVFSFGSVLADTQYSFLYKKENGKWSILERIGIVDNY